MTKEEIIKMLEDLYEWNDHRDYEEEGNTAVAITNQKILNLIEDIKSL